MSHATVKCTCRVCGKSFAKELYESGKGASSRLDEKVKWAEAGGIDLCTDCWKQQQDARRKEQGLVADIRLSNPLADGEAVLYAVFDGDTMPVKDTLKAAGARWTDRYPQEGVLASVLNFDQPPKRWVLKAAEAEELGRILDTLPLKSVTWPSGEELTIWRAFKAESLRYDEQRRAEKAEAARAAEERKAAALAELGPCPPWPESVKAKWPDGGKWNGTIYGKKPGSRRVYLGGVEVRLTDEEAAAMTEAAAARAEWRRKKEAIK